MEMWSARLTSSANCSDFLPNPDSRLTETDLYWRESPPPRTSQRNPERQRQSGRLLASCQPRDSWHSFSADQLRFPWSVWLSSGFPIWPTYASVLSEPDP